MTRVEKKKWRKFQKIPNYFSLPNSPNIAIIMTGTKCERTHQIWPAEMWGQTDLFQLMKIDPYDIKYQNKGASLPDNHTISEYGSPGGR